MKLNSFFAPTLALVSALVLLTSPVKSSAGESEENRADKKLMVVGQLVGYGPSAASTIGANIGYFVSPNFVVLIEGMKNVYPDNEDFNNIKYDKRDAYEGGSYGAHLKFFIGNSFYVRGGLDQREFNYRYNDSAAGNSSGFDSKSLAVSASIGNQWQWENFTMGCDWLGIVRPIVTNFSNEYVNQASVGSQARNKFQEQRDLVRGKEPLYLRFYLGASF
jgi:hypothetical protein